MDQSYINMAFFHVVRALTVGLLVSHTSYCSQPAIYYSRDQLAEHPVPRLGSWDATVTAVLEGEGSLITRQRDVQNKLDQWHKLTDQERDHNLKNRLGWSRLKVAPTKTLWDADVVAKEGYTKFEKSIFPYQLPEDVTHFIYWIRPSFIPNNMFAGFSFTTRRALKAYIQHFDFCGSYGVSTDTLSSIRRLRLAHPTDDHVWKESDDPITRELGLLVMRDVGAKINELMQCEFPENTYEVVWNHSPNRIKSVQNPDYFDVFVKTKT